MRCPLCHHELTVRTELTAELWACDRCGTRVFPPGHLGVLRGDSGLEGRLRAAAGAGTLRCPACQRALSHAADGVLEVELCTCGFVVVPGRVLEALAEPAELPAVDESGAVWRAEERVARAVDGAYQAGDHVSGAASDRVQETLDGTVDRVDSWLERLRSRVEGLFR